MVSRTPRPQGQHREGEHLMPRLWQQQADESRQAAARTTHPDLKRELLSIAEAYEHRAKLAREKALTRKRVGKNR
jgi:hypothetical protein